MSPLVGFLICCYALLSMVACNSSTNTQADLGGLNSTGRANHSHISGINSTLLTNSNSSVAPASALDSYLRSGFAAGLSGRPVNIESELYRGEFLYLARNSSSGASGIDFNGAVLRVGKDRLRERAWLWEFFPAPNEGNSTFYLRNKLNEHEPIPLQRNVFNKFNYIVVEIASSTRGAHPSRLLIHIKSTAWARYYYPISVPNTDSALKGRQIYQSSTSSSPDTEWILNFPS